jgi:hypothetical protein
MLNVLVPVFVIINTWDKELPTTVFPKLIEAGLT